MEEELHIGRSGIDIKGHNAILMGLLVVTLIALAVLVGIIWKHLETDAEEKTTIQGRVEVLQQDHDSFKEVVARMAASMNAVTEQMELQSWLMVADDSQVKEAKKRMKEDGVPKLLRRKE